MYIKNMTEHRAVTILKSQKKSDDRTITPITVFVHEQQHLLVAVDVGEGVLVVIGGAVVLLGAKNTQFS